MYLYLIPSLYLLAYLLFFLILNWWLGNAFAGYLEMKRWRRIFFFIVYVLAAPPILGCFLPDSKVKFVLTAVGNIWLGYFLYIGIIAVPLSIIAGPAVDYSRRFGADARREYEKKPDYRPALPDHFPCGSLQRQSLRHKACPRCESA